MHLIINLIFLTSFQFINLSNLTLWVNNRRKWITVIFLNLCDNFLLYDLFLSFVFGHYLYLSLYLCLYLSLPLFWHSPNPTTNTMNLFCFLHQQQKTFPNFTIFFLSLVPIISQLPVNKEQTVKHYTNIFSNLSLSLSLSLSYKRESHKHKVTESHKAKKPKNKIHHRHRFNSQSPTQLITH